MLLFIFKLFLGNLVLLFLERCEVVITHLLHMLFGILLILSLLGCATVVQEKLREKVNRIIRLCLVRLRERLGDHQAYLVLL
jgi:hypothetical protein